MGMFLIMMRNLTQGDGQGVERVFDIKGSQYNRSAIKEKKI